MNSCVDLQNMEDIRYMPTQHGKHSLLLLAVHNTCFSTELDMLYMLCILHAIGHRRHFSYSKSIHNILVIRGVNVKLLQPSND